MRNRLLIPSEQYKERTRLLEWERRLNDGACESLQNWSRKQTQNRIYKVQKESGVLALVLAFLCHLSEKVALWPFCAGGNLYVTGWKKKKKKQKKTAFVSMKGSCWISSEMFHWVLKTICRYFSKTFDSLVRGASYPRVFSVDASCLFGITSTKITSYFQNVLGSFVCSMLMVAAVTLELKSELKECLYSAFIGKPVM